MALTKEDKGYICMIVGGLCGLFAWDFLKAFTGGLVLYGMCVFIFLCCMGAMSKALIVKTEDLG